MLPDTVELDQLNLVRSCAYLVFDEREGLSSTPDVIRKSVTGLPRDPPLAAFGEAHGCVQAQAQELADYFLSLPEDQRPTAIFSSPFYRCLQTSQPTAKALGLPIHIEHAIGEWYSPVVPNTGLLHPRPGPPSSLVQYFPEIDTTAWPSSLWYPSRKGETIEELHDRVAGFLALLPQALARRPDIDARRVLFVSHAATAIALVRQLLGDKELPLKYGCCALSELELKPGASGEQPLGAYTAVKLADGGHMKEGAAREWGFSDVEVEKGRVRGCGVSAMGIADAVVLLKVVEDPGELGSDVEEDFPVGPQMHILSNL
ncbi:hypothetical protein D9611_006886 [Ephemerocybe angulata]|uniref:Uncharacterized protein n=1 Tax=Ephemerocybe angulata TaxID=980116 RepID=A0A8H5AZU8_9AGAR|nr:hypothetical protein D9611_006886 [Tulosesus angulatus]